MQFLFAPCRRPMPSGSSASESTDSIAVEDENNLDWAKQIEPVLDNHLGEGARAFRWVLLQMYIILRCFRGLKGSTVCALAVRSVAGNPLYQQITPSRSSDLG